jgi:hypothetical protein
MFAGLGFLRAYLVTVTTEAIVISFLNKKQPVCLSITASIIINSFTHPVFIGYGVHVFDMPMLLAEFFIFAVEMWWYHRAFDASYNKGILMSFVANSVSFMTGFLISVLW